MKSRIALLLVLAAVILSVSAYAHHSFAAMYDMGKTIRIEGRMISFSFRSPHSIVIVEAPDAEGKMQRWNATWGATGQLAQAGITRDFFKPGEKVVMTGNPGRNPNDHILRTTGFIRPADGFVWGNRPGEVVD